MAAREGKESSGPRGAPAWMVTYGDMMTLLLTFFVLIVSFSSVQDAEFKKAMGSLRGALGILGKYDYIVSLGKIVVPEATYAFMSKHPLQTTGDISKRLNFISDYEDVELYVDNRGINIVLPAKVLFEAGDDTIKEEAYPLLKKIGAFLYDVKENTLIIEGHTDNIPINTIRFPSNWHLSAARAISVARFLHEQCAIANDRMTVAGLAEYRPLVPNNSIENREKNRRVTVLVETKKRF